MQIVRKNIQSNQNTKNRMICSGNRTLYMNIEHINVQTNYIYDSEIELNIIVFQLNHIRNQNDFQSQTKKSYIDIYFSKR